MADLEKEVIASPAAVDNKASSLSLLDEANQTVEKTLGPICAPKPAPTGLDIPAFLDPRNLQAGTTTIRQESDGLQVTDPLVRLQSQFGPKRFSLGVADGSNATGALIGRNPNGLTAAGRVPELGEFAFHQREKSADFYADSPIFGALKLMRDKSGDKLSFAGDTGTVDLQQKGKTFTGSAVVSDVGSVSVIQDGKKLTASATAADGRTVAVEQTGRTVRGTVVVSDVGSVQVTNGGGTIGAEVSVADVGKVSIEKKGKTVAGSAVVPEVGSVQVTQDGRSVSAKATVADVGSVSVDQKGKKVIGSAVVPEVGSVQVTQDGRSVSAKATVADVGSVSVDQKGKKVIGSAVVPEVGSVQVTQDGRNISAKATVADVGSVSIEQKGKTVVGSAVIPEVGSMNVAPNGQHTSAKISLNNVGTVGLEQKGKTVVGTAVIPEVGTGGFTRDGNKLTANVSIPQVGTVGLEQKGKTVVGSAVIPDAGTVNYNHTRNSTNVNATVDGVGNAGFSQTRDATRGELSLRDVGAFSFENSGRKTAANLGFTDWASIGYERTATSISAKFGLPDFGSFGFERKGATTRANLDIPETGSLGLLLGPDRVRLDAKLDDISLRMEQRGSVLNLAAQGNTGSFESLLGANKFSTALSRKDFGSFSVAADKDSWSAKATVEQGKLDIEQTRTGFEALVGINGVGRFQLEQKGPHNRNAFLNSDTYGSLRFTESAKGSQVSIQDKLFGGSARIVDTPSGTRIVVDTLPRIPGTTLGAEGKVGIFNYKSQLGLSDATLTLDATVGDAQLRARVTESYNVTNLINGNPEKFKKQLGQPRADVSVVLPHGTQAALKFEPGANGRTGAPMIEVGRHGSLPNGNKLDLNLKFNPATNRTSYSVEAGGSKTFEYGPRVPSRPVRTFRYGVSATGGDGNQPGLAGKLQLDF